MCVMIFKSGKIANLLASCQNCTCLQEGYVIATTLLPGSGGVTLSQLVVTVAIKYSGRWQEEGLCLR